MTRVFVSLLLIALASPAAAQRPPAKAVAKAQVAKAQPAAKRQTAAQKAKINARGSKLAAKLAPKTGVERTKHLADSYAKEHGLEKRTVMVGPAGSQVERVFVPITPGTMQAFYKKFTASGGNESVVLRYTPANKHMIMSVEPGDIYLWGVNKNVAPAGRENIFERLYNNMKPEAPEWKGQSYVVHPSNMKVLKQFLTDQAPKGQCQGHCMMWLPNAPTGKTKAGDDVNLATDLGITRSADGKVLRDKIMHAGNDRVGVVGVHVQTLQEFKQMTNEQLVGDLPQVGLEKSRAKQAP